MQQLTLQFDGYADSRPVIDVSTTKPYNLPAGCSHAGNTMFPYWEITLPTPGIKSMVRKALATTVLFAQATLCVLFCFALMFLAALLQG